MVSLSASAEVTINREPADVWAYVSDVTNQDHWVDGMSDSEIVGNGPVGRGTQIRGVYTYGGNDGPVEMTVTEFREGRELAIETSEGPFPFTGRLTLERSGTSTIVSNSMTAGSDHIVTSIMFLVLRPLTKWMMTRQLRKELGQLKAILEGD
ncbi:MAG: SRPBCC family protein [Chloroflexi bacterium]|nr:SRPBCC family protein [Chloroflexota bacterium]MCY3588649.1 SRPBCC family protein [Chloroflexota bacterium]MCY3686051.1 SRPBCC family protein [Chloroflexota bacterium]MDE2709874.1 SRPBCC family protein [Chloroflexota bacterium]